MTKTYIYERNGKVIRFSNNNEKKGNHDILEVQGLPLCDDTIEVLNDILLNGNYREQAIVEDFGSIEVPKTPYGNDVIDVYNKQDEGFQVFVRSNGQYKKGSITL